MSIQLREENVKLSRTFKNIRSLYSLQDKAVCDIGCGFGEYLRLFGKGSIGITTTQNEIDYGKENNLPIVFGNAEKIDQTFFDGKRFEAIWANNLFEHLLSPHAFLIKLKKVSNNNTQVILGVPVIPKVVSLISLRWWRGTLASNHVSFFTHKTLGLTVERAGWNVRAVRPFFFKNKFLDVLCRPFAPHMYVVAENNPDFKYPPKKLKEWINDVHYAELLDITGQHENR